MRSAQRERVIDWTDIGTRIGDALGKVLDPLIGDRMRAAARARYGACRVCDAPLAGESPEHICETCHAGEVIAHGFGEGAGRVPDA